MKEQLEDGQYRILRDEEIMKVGDFALFKGAQLTLKVDEFGCTWNGWTRLTKHATNWIGKQVKETPWVVVRNNRLKRKPSGK